ncbi:MAG: abortive infection family protein [Pseudonocardia sp.]
MRAADFFKDGDLAPWDTATSVLDDATVDKLRRAPLDETGDVSACLGLLELAQEELEAYGTGGGERLDDQQIGLVIQALEAVTKRLGIPVELPFRDFRRFKSYWIKQGASGGGGWQARRDLIEELLEPTRRKLLRIDETPTPQLDQKLIENLRDPAAIREYIARIQRSIDDPPLLIGSAKELVESTAKGVLLERGWPVNDKDDLPALVNQAQRALALQPSKATPGPDGSDALKRILGGLSNVVLGLGELRNRGFGSGHGPAGERVGLRARHAQLAVNAAVTWCQLMLDTLTDDGAPWRQNPPIP